METVAGKSQLYRGKTITFDFSGGAIVETGLDGPYRTMSKKIALDLSMRAAEFAP